jgi:hypothetical protein
MMWTKYLPAAVAATGLASLHGRERYLIILTALLGVTTATSTESERAKSLLDNSGDKVGHFCLFNGENAF